MDYGALYNELRTATIDYHSAYPGSTLKAEAYTTLCEHMSGAARNKAQAADEIIADLDALLAYEDDYIVTMDSVSYRSQ